MNESLDILSRDAVDDYKEFLSSLRNEMDDLVEKTGQAARFLDGHDENHFTRGLQGFLKGMAGNTIQASSHIYGDIVEVFLRGLELKNDTVCSSAQEDYIQELRGTAWQLDDVQPYRDCELVSGGTAFNSEEQEEFLSRHIVGLVDAWDDCVSGLKIKAEALQGSMVQDEMSETFVRIISALERMVDNIAESANAAGYHLISIRSNYDERKRQFTQNAEDEGNSVQNVMSSMLGDVLDDLKDIIF